MRNPRLEHRADKNDEQPNEIRKDSCDCVRHFSLFAALYRLPQSVSRAVRAYGCVIEKRKIASGKIHGPAHKRIECRRSDQRREAASQRLTPLFHRAGDLVYAPIALSMRQDAPGEINKRSRNLCHSTFPGG